MSEHVISALSDVEIAAIDKELAHVPIPAGAAIDALKIVQAHRGWISDGCIHPSACGVMVAVQCCISI